MQVVFARRALRDLANLRSYISRDKPGAASRIAVEITAACDRLELFPERGRPGQIAGTRELTTVWPYVIVYKITSREIRILTVWHGKRDRRRSR